MSTRQTKGKIVFWWAVVVLGVVLAVNLSKSIIDFLRLKGRLTDAQQKLEGLKAQQQALEKEYSYKTKPEYLEKEVRDRLNMAKPGETVVIIPEADLAAATVPASLSARESSQTENLPVWKKWWRVFFSQ